MPEIKIEDIEIGDELFVYDGNTPYKVTFIHYKEKGVDVIGRDEHKAVYTHQGLSQFVRIKKNKITNWRERIENVSCK